MAGLSPQELAAATGLHVRTIRSVERRNGVAIGGYQSTTIKLIGAFERLGIVFTDDGVTLARQPARYRPIVQQDEAAP